MQIALCQFNPVIGAVSHNAGRILDFASKAKMQGAALAVFPELALCGYFPKDILYRPELKTQVAQTLQMLAEKSEIPLLVGAPEYTSHPYESYNAVFFCGFGQAMSVARKTLLPNYAVFDERRHFKPNESRSGVFEFGGIRLGITICEDAWNDELFWPTRRYAEDPVLKVVQEGADIIVNMSASPFYEDKPQRREKTFQHLAKRHHKPLIMVAQVGANDQVIFDGHSLVVDPSGHLVGRLKGFEEDIVVVDAKPGTITSPRLEELKSRDDILANALTLGIRDYFVKCRAKGALIGLSGGIDSAVTATLAVDALGKENVIGVRMPSQYSSAHSLEDAEELAYNLGIELVTIPIEPMVEVARRQIGQLVGKLADISDQNLQARMRGITLMALSNEKGHLVLATSNKSELAVGYCTIYGDMCGAIGPLADVYKTRVWELAYALNKGGVRIPMRTIHKAPSAELKADQVDQDSLPPYDQLDAVLMRYLDLLLDVTQIQQETGLSMELIQQIVGMVRRSEYKRSQAAPSLMTTEQVFGQARRWPVAQNFDPFLKQNP